MSEEKQLDIIRRNSAAEFKSTIFLSAGVILLIVSFFTVLTNSMLLVTLYRDPLKCFRTKTSVLIGCLGVTDFMVGALPALGVGIVHVRLSLGYPPFKVNGVPLPKLISQFTVWSGILITTVFSVERFIAIAFPFFYRNHVTKTKLLMTCVVIWLTCFFANFMEVTGIKETTYNTVELYAFFVVPLVIVVLAYCGLYYKVRKQGKIQDALTGNTTAAQRRDARHRKRERQLAVTAFFIVLSFVVSYSPWFVFYWIGTACFECLGTQWLLAGNHLSIPLLYLNSMFNPLLYVWRVTQYRRSFVALFRGSAAAGENTEGSTMTASDGKHQKLAWENKS